MIKFKYRSTEKVLKTIIIFGLGIICLIVYPKNVAAVSKIEQKQLIKNLFENYDGDIRPLGINGSGPTIVHVSMNVRSIEDVNDNAMQWKTQLTFRMQWNDGNLEFNPELAGVQYVTLPDSYSDQIWKPDLFFINEVQMHYHNALQRNAYIRVFADGNVTYNTRLSLILRCPMDLKLYPFDTQICTCRMSSYRYTTQDIIFKWRSTNPVQITSDLHLQKFSLAQFTTNYCDTQNSNTNAGVYSCLRVDFQFPRVTFIYLNQYFVPMICSIFLAWLSFWLDPVILAVPRSIFLAICFLYFHFTVHDSKTGSPQNISYGTLLDRWICVCSIFIYLSILEFVIVSYLGNNGRSLKNATTQNDENVQTICRTTNDENTQLHPTSKKYLWFKTPINMSVPFKMDFLFRIIYPTTFIIYAIGFFSIVKINKTSEQL